MPKASNMLLEIYSPSTASKMKDNAWNDKWLALPRGQRRATVVLLCVVVLLAIAQLVATHIAHHRNQVTADYTALEQEIVQFCSQLDTVPDEERRPAYIRRTHARPDSALDNSRVVRKSVKAISHKPQRPIEAVPRLDETAQ